MGNPDHKRVSASNDQFAPSSEFPIYPAVKVTVTLADNAPQLIPYTLWKLTHNSHRRNGKFVKQTFLSLSSFLQDRDKLEIQNQKIFLPSKGICLVVGTYIMGLTFYCMHWQQETGLELKAQVCCQIGRSFKMSFKTSAYKRDCYCRFWQLITMTVALYKSTNYSSCY